MLYNYLVPEPPKCIKVYSDEIEIRNAGDTVVLRLCDLTSTVLQLLVLDFQWSVQLQNWNPHIYREWEMITPGGRFSVNYDGFLTISNVQPSDSGLYQVSISNNQGSALHFVWLEVTPTPLLVASSHRMIQY